MAPPQYGSSRSYPSAPSSLYSFRHPRPRDHSPERSVKRVKRVGPPEDKVPNGEEQHAVIKKSDSPYDEAYTYVERFKMAVGSLDSYEKPLSIKMSRGDWSKLSHDLKIFDTDQRYRISFYDP
jgi:hypothetical protein